eukprot:scaffold23803_cov132-Cylindrotheca_fusiformis.AAC.4
MSSSFRSQRYSRKKPAGLYDTSPSTSESSSSQFRRLTEQPQQQQSYSPATSNIRQSASPQYSYPPSTSASPSQRQSSNLPQNELASFHNVEEAGRNILRSARQRLDARRQSEGIMRPSTPQIWNSKENSSCVTPTVSGSQRTQPQVQRSYQAQEQVAGPSPSLDSREGGGSSLRSVPSLSPSLSRSFEGKMFQSKYFDAARAARLQEKKEKASLETNPPRPLSQPRPIQPNPSRSLSQPRPTQTDPSRPSSQPRPTEPNPSRSLSQPRPTQPSYTSADMSRAIETRAENRIPAYSNIMAQSMMPTRPPTTDFRTSSPKSATSYETRRSHESLENSRRSSPKSPSLSPTTNTSFIPPPSRRLATTTLQGEGILRDGSTIMAQQELGMTRGRPRSSCVEQRMRTFSKERSDAIPPVAPELYSQERIDIFSHERIGVPLPTTTRASYATSSSSGQYMPQRSPRSDGVAESTRQERRKLPEIATKAQPERYDANAATSAGSVRGKRSNIAAFWNSKGTKEPPRVIKPNKSQPELTRKSWDGEVKAPDATEIKAKPGIDLMAKLSAVDRGDPAVALAQIDSILQEETRKKSFEPILINNNDDDSAAGTTISSLTNPDYRESQQHRGTARSSPNNLSQTSPNAVTTSSFRGPRPSSLKNYTPSTHHMDVQELPRKSTSQKHQQPATRHQERPRVNDLSPILNEGLGKLRKNAIGQRSSISPARRPHPWDGDPAESPTDNIGRADVSVSIDGDQEVTKHERRGAKGRPSENPSSVAEGLLEESFEFGKPGVHPVTPSKDTSTATGLTPLQYENAKKISDNFDATWASMPGIAPSPVTPDASTKSERKPRRRSQSTRSSTVDLDASFDSRTTGSRSYHSRSLSHSEGADKGEERGEHFSIEVSLYDASSNSAGEQKDKSKPKRRGFLKSLKSLQNGKKGTANSSAGNSESLESGVHSGSNASAGARSASTQRTPPSVYPPMTPSFSPSSQLQREYSMQSRSNGNGQPRDHSESTDFRTASMAQKYSRVMRLYDDD